MGGMSDLMIDIEDYIRSLHAQNPRPTWQEAVAEIQREFTHEARKDRREDHVRR